MLLKKITLPCFAVLFSLLWSCKTKQLTIEEKAQNRAKLDSLYNQNEFNIDVEVAYPFNTAATTRVASVLLQGTGDNPNRIDLRGDGNYFKIENDSLKAYLPFFGERRLNGGDYGGQNSAIQIEESLKDLSKELNIEKDKLELEFSANQKGSDGDKYEISIDIYSNEYTTINITPVFRTFMRYDGRLEKFDTEK